MGQGEAGEVGKETAARLQASRATSEATVFTIIAMKRCERVFSQDERGSGPRVS